MAVEVDKDGVKDQDLEALAAVQSFLAANGEGSVLMLAGVSCCAHLSFTAFLALGTPLTSWSLLAPFSWHPRLSPVSFLSCRRKQRTQLLCDTKSVEVVVRKPNEEAEDCTKSGARPEGTFLRVTIPLVFMGEELAEL